MTTFHISDYWTPEQAQTAYEFLGELRNSIWEQYGDSITEMYKSDLQYVEGNPPSGEDNFNDDISF